jgi:hypothetical protein
MGGSPKRHHYLPQSYLREFGRDETVWVYDRSANEIRNQLVVDTTVKRHFYSVEMEDGTRDSWVENVLATIDGLIPNLISELRCGLIFDHERRFELALVAALFLNRTPGFHEDMERVEGDLIKRAAKLMFRTVEDAEQSLKQWKSEVPDAPEIDRQELFDLYKNGDYQVKIHRNRTIELMAKLSPKFAEMIAPLSVLVLHACEKSAFITCDRPFIITPPRDMSKIPKWAGVGIRTPGAEKLLPLASDIAVIFGDPGDDFRHINVTQDVVKRFNETVGLSTDRFFLGRDEALVAAWMNRLDLANCPRSPIVESF